MAPHASDSIEAPKKRIFQRGTHESGSARASPLAAAMEHRRLVTRRLRLVRRHAQSSHRLRHRARCAGSTARARAAPSYVTNDSAAATRTARPTFAPSSRIDAWETRAAAVANACLADRCSMRFDAERPAALESSPMARCMAGERAELSLVGDATHATHSSCVEVNLGRSQRHPRANICPLPERFP